MDRMSTIKFCVICISTGNVIQFEAFNPANCLVPAGDCGGMQK